MSHTVSTSSLAPASQRILYTFYCEGRIRKRIVCLRLRSVLTLFFSLSFRNVFVEYWLKFDIRKTQSTFSSLLSFIYILSDIPYRCPPGVCLLFSGRYPIPMNLYTSGNIFFFFSFLKVRFLPNSFTKMNGRYGSFTFDRASEFWVPSSLMSYLRSNFRKNFADSFVHHIY